MQLLANRYAVLGDYRGSTGFGLKFLNAGTNEWGVERRRIYSTRSSGPRRGVIKNGSRRWDGRAGLRPAAPEMRPEMFACGINGVGPADLATLFRSFQLLVNIMMRWRRRGAF